MLNSKRTAVVLAGMVFAAILIVCGIMLWLPEAAHAAGLTLPDVRLDLGTGAGTATDAEKSTFQILAMLTVLTLAPSILVMLTGFTRIVIVLSFLRNALGTQQIPPNQVIIGLSLFLTLFVMSPVLTEIDKNAYQPFQKGQLTQEQFIERASGPIRDFMVGQTRESDIALFLRLSEAPKPKAPKDIPMYVLMPAFAISELKTAFQMAFAIFLPFLVVDMVVSSTLMSMGMMMLPPAMISLPFKIMLFVMVNGWELTARSLVTSFR